MRIKKKIIKIDERGAKIYFTKEECTIHKIKDKQIVEIDLSNDNLEQKEIEKITFDQLAHGKPKDKKLRLRK